MIFRKAEGRQDSAKYTRTLKDNLLPWREMTHGYYDRKTVQLMFQEQPKIVCGQESECIRLALSSFQPELRREALSYASRALYEYGKQFGFVQKLKDRIVDCWSKLAEK